MEVVRLFTALCVFASSGLVRASAQSTVIVAGVADVSTGAPIEGALVRLPELGRTAVTNWIGEATFNGVASGAQYIEVRKLGYAPADIKLMVRGDSVGPVFRLGRATSSLDTVRVLGTRYPERMREYFVRRRMGIGRFLSDSVLQKEKNRELALALSMRFPGVRAKYNPNAGRYELTSTRTTAGSTLGQIVPCSVDVYIDGMQLDDAIFMDAGDLAGAEFYSMGSAPVQYRRMSQMGGRSGRSPASCAVLLLWSKW